MKRSQIYRAVCLLLVTASAFASARQDAGPWVGQVGVRETVAQIMNRDRTAPKELVVIKQEKEIPEKFWASQNPLSPAVSQWPPAPIDQQPEPMRLLGGGGKPSMGPFSLGANFLTASSSESPYVPPDTQGAVGPTQFLVCVNGRIKVYNKNGVLGSLNATTNAFFTSVRNGSSTSDPRVRYDRLTQKWFVVMINVAGQNNRILLAVSDGPTITATTVWTFFFMQQNLVAPTGDNNLFADYPTLGVDANALYIGCDMFAGNTYMGTSGWVIRKSSVTGAGPIVATAFRALTGGSATGAGPESPMGVDNDDPNATVGYFIGADNASWGTLTLRRVSNPGGTPTISGNIFVTVPTTYFPLVVPQTGTTTTMDALNDRLFSAQIRTNRLTGEQTLWTSHNIRVTTGGVGDPGGTRTASRWYQLGSLSTTPALLQAGTVYDNAATNPKHYWIPTVNMNGQGHMAIGMSYSSLSDHPSVYYATRFASDPAGTVGTPLPVVVSTTTYAPQGNGTNRWGDYSMTSVDPLDDMTIWSIQEYCNASNSWGVRVFQLTAPGPATPTGVVPPGALQGATLNVVVTGSSVANSGFFDPGAGFNRLQAAFSGTGVTVNSVTMNTPTQVTLNVTVAGNAATGPRNLTITNPDGQSATLNNAFTVNAASISVPPSSFSTSRGNLVSGTLADLLTSDNAYVVWSAGPVLSSSENPVDVSLNATSPIANPSTLVFRLEGRGTASNLGQTIWLFNYVTNGWEQVDTHAVATGDSVTTVTISTNAARFINSSTLAMRARFGIKPTGPILSYPWGFRADQVEWVVSP